MYTESLSLLSVVISYVHRICTVLDTEAFLRQSSAIVAKSVIECHTTQPFPQPIQFQHFKRRDETTTTTTPRSIFHAADNGDRVGNEEEFLKGRMNDLIRGRESLGPLSFPSLVSRDCLSRCCARPPSLCRFALEMRQLSMLLSPP